MSYDYFMDVKFPKAKEKAQEIISLFSLKAPVKIFQLGEAYNLSWDVLNPEALEKIILDKGEVEDKELLKSFGIKSILGYLLKDQSCFYLNSENNKYPSRQRLTYAHELGHYLLGHEGDRFRIVTDSDLKNNTSQEAEANAFAAYILMPDEELTDLIPKIKLFSDYNELQDYLSKYFAVSKDAISYRLQTYKRENSDYWEIFSLSDNIR